jgi:hypothetical protein
VKAQPPFPFWKTKLTRRRTEGLRWQKVNGELAFHPMRRNSILRKLSRELAQDITTERQVMYILVEVRKAIEQEREIENYHALDFYCSFALHTKMSKIGAQRILERFDKAHPILVKDEPLPRYLHGEIGKTTKLTNFREEMKAFVTTNNLPTRLFTKPDEWVEFVHHYGNVIDECELELEGDTTRLKFINRVVVHLETASNIVETEFGNQILFRLCWTCHGKDGTSGNHYVIFGFDVPSKSKKGAERQRRSGRTGVRQRRAE